MASENLMVFFARVAKQISHGVRREFPSPHRCVVSLPGGFPYEAFDGKAEIKPWHILCLVESCRSVSFIPLGNDGRSYLDFQDIYSRALAFIVSARLEILPQMYDVTVPKRPLRIEKELLHHGTSSMNMRSCIFSANFDRLLARVEQQTVAVSKETRRPAPLPDWWKNKYLQFNDAGSALRFQPSTRPSQSEITSYPMVVQASDTDSYFHVNWAYPLKFCLDAYAGATWQRNKSVNIMDLYRPVKSAELVYVREISLGDQLTVDFWSDKTSQLQFEILNSDKKVALHSSVEYFPKSFS